MLRPTDKLALDTKNYTLPWIAIVAKQLAQRTELFIPKEESTNQILRRCKDRARQQRDRKKNCSLLEFEAKSSNFEQTYCLKLLRGL